MAKNCKVNPAIKQLASEYIRLEKMNDLFDEQAEIALKLAKAIKTERVLVCRGRSTTKKG